jgi:hypothetical protein
MGKIYVNMQAIYGSTEEIIFKDGIPVGQVFHGSEKGFMPRSCIGGSSSVDAMCEGGVHVHSCGLDANIRAYDQIYPIIKGIVGVDGDMMHTRRAF